MGAGAEMAGGGGDLEGVGLAFVVSGLALALIGGMCLAVLAKRQVLAWQRSLAERASRKPASLSEFHVTGLETQEPTSHEFLEMFTDLMQPALKEPHRRLVVVLENMDRISPADTRRMWNTLRVFSQRDTWEQYEGWDVPDWHHRYWMLVPFDHMQARRTAGEATPGGATDTSDGTSPGRAARDDRIDRDTGYIERLFQYWFHVPDPVLSKWLDFARGEIRKSLGQDEAVVERVTQVYQFAMQQETLRLTPTPRNIEQFARNLQAIGLVAQQITVVDDDNAPTSDTPKAIGVLHQAVYAALRSASDFDPNAVANSIISQGSVVETFEHLFATRELAPNEGEEAELRTALACLHTALPGRLALQTLMRAAIRTALRKGDKSGFEPYLAAEGFREALMAEVLQASDDRIRPTGSDRATPCAITASAVALDQAGIENDELWEWLAKDAAAVPRWWDVDAMLAAGLVMIIRRGRRLVVDFLPDLLANLAATLGPGDSSVDPKGDAEVDAEKFVPVLVDIFQQLHAGDSVGALDDLDIRAELRNGFSPPDDFDRAMVCLTVAAKHCQDPEVLRYFQPADPTEIVRYTVLHWDDEIAIGAQLGVAGGLVALGPSWDWQILIEHIHTSVQNIAQDVGRDAPHAFEWLFCLSAANTDGPDFAEVPLRTLTEDKHTITLLGRGEAYTDARIGAHLTLAILLYAPSAETHDTDYARKGQDRYMASFTAEARDSWRHVARLAVQYGRVHDLISEALTPDHPAPARTRLVVEGVIEERLVDALPSSEELWRLMGPDLEVAEAWSGIREVLAFADLHGENALHGETFEEILNSVRLVRASEQPIVSESHSEDGLDVSSSSDPS